MAASLKFVCEICGYPGLREPPRRDGGGGSYEICPCCDFEYGVTDEDLGISDEDWRQKWIADGMPWRNPRTAKPENWNATEQLKRVIKPS